MSLLKVSISPHIVTRRATRTVMLDVIIALLPALIAGCILFGARALAVAVVCVGVAVLTEYLFCLLCRKEQTVTDLSAVVTGLLLALNLPVSIPLWQGALGAVFAIAVVKCLFGGIGQNFANPAITARIFLLVCFSSSMTGAASVLADTVSSATPLASGGENLGQYGYWTLFLGNYGGAIGETCSLALLLGFVYLLLRRVISWTTPVAFVGTVVLLSYLFGRDGLAQALSGGLLLGAIFMATDYATTPVTKWGKVLFGVGCGLITVVIRFWGNLPEGVSYSILLMNLLTPYLEKWTEQRPLGGVKG